MLSFWIVLIYAGLAAFVYCCYLIAHWFSRERRYEVVMRDREILGGHEFHQRYYDGSAVPEFVADEVRKIFADQFGYDAGRLRPEDKFSWIIEEVDSAPLIKALEERFGLALGSEELEKLNGSVDSVIRLVARRLGAKDEVKKDELRRRLVRIG